MPKSVNISNKDLFDLWCGQVRTEAEKADVAFLIPDGNMEDAQESFDDGVTPLEFVEEQVSACQ